MRESEIHQAFARFLDKANIAYIHSNTHRRSSTTPGDPDFVLLKNGFNLSVELKVLGGKLSPDQIKRHQTITHAGNDVAVAFSVEEAVGYVNQWITTKNIFKR